MVCFKVCVLLLCLVVAINGATLRDLFNRPNYKFSDRTEADDTDKFWQNYDRLIEVGIKIASSIQYMLHLLTVKSQFALMRPTLLFYSI